MYILPIPCKSFYSQFDEHMFFTWLSYIPCVRDYQGQGTTLYVYVSPMSENDHQELEALLNRYQYDIALLDEMYKAKDEI